MNEQEIIDIDEDYMEDFTLATEFEWNQLQIEEKKSGDLSYEQEDWMSACY